MSLLQPWMLFALPLVALPVIIHLIHRNRHRSVRWAATMFLLQANRMQKGMARLRYVLIMLARMLAVAAMIFAVGRPLVSGKLGGLGMGRPDATLVLLDRSASMESRDLQSGASKRSTALAKLTGLLKQRGHGDQLVLVDSASGKPQVIETPEALLELPMTQASVTRANLPSMFETALAYLKASEAGRADVWVCSDLSAQEWDAEGGRWQAIREQFTQMKGVHHFLLSYAESPANNLSVRVANVKRRPSADRAELVMDVHLEGYAQSGAKLALGRVPVEFEINRVRSVVEMDLKGGEASLLGHRIPIDSSLRSGWGSVTLPGDANPQDNRFYFVFSEPAIRKTLVVSEDGALGESFRLSLSIPAEPGLEHAVEVMPPAQAGEIRWDEIAMLIWQAPLPQGLMAEEIERFIQTGRVGIFFPPQRPGSAPFMGVRWETWETLEEASARQLIWWRDDADLLGHTDGGEPLPLDALRTFRLCAFRGGATEHPLTPLARLAGEKPLLARASTDQGAAYFCATLPSVPYSSMEQDAVSFYIMLQRALVQGSRAMSPASQREAGPELSELLETLEPLAPQANPPSLSQRPFVAGVYRDATSWVAVNRSVQEDAVSPSPVGMIDRLFEGLPYQRIDDTVGDTSSLASEVWRLFLFLMALALLLEAILCLPEKPEARTDWTSLGAKGISPGEEAA
jgi:hypothetical protein